MHALKGHTRRVAACCFFLLTVLLWSPTDLRTRINAFLTPQDRAVVYWTLWGSLPPQDPVCAAAHARAMVESGNWLWLQAQLASKRNLQPQVVRDKALEWARAVVTHDSLPGVKCLFAHPGVHALVRLRTVMLACEAARTAATTTLPWLLDQLDITAARGIALSANTVASLLCAAAQCGTSDAPLDAVLHYMHTASVSIMPASRVDIWMDVMRLCSALGAEGTCPTWLDRLTRIFVTIVTCVRSRHGDAAAAAAAVTIFAGGMTVRQILAMTI